jgi:hypothetical protein
MDYLNQEVDIPLGNALAVEMSKGFEQSSVGEGDKATTSSGRKRNANGRVHNGLA